MVRDPQLVLGGQVTAVLGLEAHVDGVALGDELVEPEGEERTAAGGVAGPTPSKEHPTDGVLARGMGHAGQGVERFRCGGNRRRGPADERTGCVPFQAEGRFDPAGQRVPSELVVVGGDVLGGSPLDGIG